jgi:hypothetical protein
MWVESLDSKETSCGRLKVKIDENDTQYICTTRLIQLAETCLTLKGRDIPFV